MSIGAEGLLTSLLWMGGLLVISTAVVLLVVWLGRRRGSTTIALDAADSLSRVWLAAVALGIVWSIVQAFQPFVSADDVPAFIEWPGRPDGGVPTTGAGPQLQSAVAHAVSVTAVGVTGGTRVVIAVGTLLGLLLWALPAVVVQILTRKSLTGTPFTPGVGRALMSGAVGLLLLGTSADLVQQIGRNLLAQEVLAPPDSGEALTALSYFPLTLPLWPAAAALAVAALATVFRYGARLQRETEGLV